jgi:hypothetical protein
MAKEQGSRKRRRASSKEQSSEKLDEKIRVLAREELRKLMRLARYQRDVDNFIDHGVFPEAPIQPTPPASDPSPLQNKSTSCSGTECQLDPLGPPDENLTVSVFARYEKLRNTTIMLQSIYDVAMFVMRRRASNAGYTCRRWGILWARAGC